MRLLTESKFAYKHKPTNTFIPYNNTMLDKSTNHHLNYLASIVEVKDFRPHPNADRLKIATVFGNNLILSVESTPGLYVYFPVESALSPEFLSYTNSFRESERNTDKTKKGFFEYHGRIKPLKLRGVASEGYLIPLQVLADFTKGFLKKELDVNKLKAGDDFDTVQGHQICQKYIPRGVRQANNGVSKKTKGNIKRYVSRLVENQFHFHQDTSHLKRQVANISPEDYISITDKLHGANFIVSHVLVKKQLSWKEKIAKWFGVSVQDTEYGMLYSSRAVIKNANVNLDKNPNHFYGEDIWKIVADKAFPCLRKGISIIGEVVGYTPAGGYIQKSYDYGCDPGQLDFYVFKMTYTSASGDVYVFSHREMVDYCAKFGLKTPRTFFHGKAKDVFPEIPVDENWHDAFLQSMITHYLEKKCDLCKNDVWAEGVVLRKETPHEWDAYKLKSFNFLNMESTQLDDGLVDIETQEAENTVEEE